MLNRHEKLPGWLNQPYKLSMTEVENPFAVVEDFFDHDYLYGHRDSLWEMMKSNVTGNYSKRLSTKERENMVTSYEMIERLIESCYLINELHKSGKIVFNKAAENTAQCEEEYPDQHNPIIEGIMKVGDKIPGIEKVYLIKYHSRIDYTASLLVLTHGNTTNHEQLEQNIRAHFQEDWPVNILIRTATEVFNLWKEGNIFYNRICWKERLIYDAGNIALPDSKLYSLDDIKNKAMGLFENISSVVPGFLLGAKNYANEKMNALSAFSLHQAAEHSLRALLISIMGFSPYKHNLRPFLKSSLFLTEKLIEVFNEEDIKEEKFLCLLNKAYVKARYVNDDQFIITDEDLALLHSKVHALVMTTEKVFYEVTSQTGTLSSSPYFTKADCDL
ncbi:HEPN domain-containing protein [Chitinophaga sp. CC14]|uniref:HEPN domain-containing protein n=1 Tax=Chitinophaga sp. CC14 TaxID=3029199 RepID=UPI003B77900B